MRSRVFEVSSCYEVNLRCSKSFLRGGGNILTLKRATVFFWDTASQSITRQDMLEILGSPGYACGQNVDKVFIQAFVLFLSLEF